MTFEYQRNLIEKKYFIKKNIMIIFIKYFIKLRELFSK